MLRLMPRVFRARVNSDGLRCIMAPSEADSSAAPNFHSRLDFEESALAMRCERLRKTPISSAFSLDDRAHS